MKIVGIVAAAIVVGLVLSGAAVPPEDETAGLQGLFSMILTAVISAGVISAVITSLVSFLINRRNSRIAERKNSVDAESDLIARYKEAAAEERVQKESAVKTLRELQEATQTQVVSLKDTINTLNNTISNLNSASNIQQSDIDRIAADRDRLMGELLSAQEKLQKQEQQLEEYEQEIIELTESRNKPRTGSIFSPPSV